mgnify:CR=1 FL=1
MGFGGSVSAMVTSLKNNKRVRPSALNKIKQFEKGKYKEGSIDKKASPELLKDIRLKTKKEEKIRWIKNLIALIILITIFFLIAWLS